jgi:hypothetical protein
MKDPRRKRTPEERERERQERDRITRELKERIEYHRARLAAQEREEGTATG